MDIFSQETLYLSFIWKESHKRLSKHPLFATFPLFSKVSEVCNISSKCWLPNKSANKSFYTRHLTPLLDLKLKTTLSIAESFRNILFSPHFYDSFQQWMRYVILQTKTKLLVIQQNINIFTQEALVLPSFKEKDWRSPSQTYSKTSTFYHIFVIFKSEWGL